MELTSEIALNLWKIITQEGGKYTYDTYSWKTQRNSKHT